MNQRRILLGLLWRVDTSIIFVLAIRKDYDAEKKIILSYEH